MTYSTGNAHGRRTAHTTGRCRIPQFSFAERRTQQLAQCRTVKADCAACVYFPRAWECPLHANQEESHEI